MIELHRKSLHSNREQLLRLRRLSVGLGDPSGSVMTATGGSPENNINQLHEEGYGHYNLAPLESIPQKFVQVDERGK